MCAGEVGEDLLGVDGDDRAVADVHGLFASALVVLPRTEGGLEERCHVGWTRPPRLADEVLVDALAFVVAEVERHVAELADTWSAGPDLAFLVDDRLVVLGRRGVESEHGPAVLDR